ncbi:transcriptional regulator, TetR family [Anaerocolumna jejuensis DSM 15929]|uniref:Transcriptional regulator, TetR family n=1 Tax=Anaerocolumna jejuensis DSM 15929 TaxID=1121322 RepID=A0A1M6Q2W7_9FIRM|nr:TetR/AcrR family transcriptional regulator [Anaerocolumna jejuensis]SHK14436.1 transcriptional regulator, TetR family [Anaerocolumna jejuensis DSM 15929]
MRKKDDEKEKSIKEAVIKLILQEGFHGASISKIAKLAGVSPATVYIYYENKENMLQDIYSEYSEEVYDYLINKVDVSMGGQQLVEVLIRSYYGYILEHKEIYSFVEQFSNCPSLANHCSGKKNVCNIYNLIQDMKQNKIIKEYSEEIIMAFIFYPVKAIAVDSQKSEAERGLLLQEMIKVIQDAILV